MTDEVEEPEEDKILIINESIRAQRKIKLKEVYDLYILRHGIKCKGVRLRCPITGQMYDGKDFTN